ncbi:MAG: cytochrome P450 [Methylobacteriaceae bacterium]|nr:cytochrome P450 [Methylobacteriaceae bacterium]
MLTTATRHPVSDIDPFSDAFLTDPYPFHEELREAGPVVRLERYGIWTMARHEQVSAALADWQTFSSGAGVGIDDFRKGRPWRPKSLLLEVDPPLHTRTRTVMNRVLAAPALRGLRETFGAEAAKLADRLVARRRFDAIADLADAYPLQVFPDAVGLRPDGRENLLPYGNMLFNSFGPRNALFRASEAACKPALEWIFESCARERLAPQGFGAAIWAAYDRGEIEESEAHILVRALLTAGLDTTVNGLGSAILAFATHPDQWQILLDDTSLLKVAFDEVLRWESPVQTFFRTTTQPVDIEGIEIPQDEKVLLFLSSANRDPRRWEEPEKFDVRRRPTGHVALGNGIHVCVGQMVARLEAEMMLGALAERVKRIEIVGEPKRKLNNTLRSLATLPVEVTPL